MEISSNLADFQKMAQFTFGSFHNIFAEHYLSYVKLSNLLVNKSVLITDIF